MIITDQVLQIISSVSVKELQTELWTISLCMLKNERNPKNEVERKQNFLTKTFV